MWNRVAGADGRDELSAFLTEGKFWTDAIAFVQAKNGPQTFGFWQIVVFAWLCNGAMHFGMADLSIFRFARSKASGWAPAIGMFLGTLYGLDRRRLAVGRSDQSAAGTGTRK